MLKKYALAMSSAAALISLVGVSALAKVERVPGPFWAISAPVAIDFTCGGSVYSHTLDTIVQQASGDFTGTGHYIADGSITWDITGNVAGNAVTFTIVYTGTNLGYTINSSGTIAADGSITGVVDNNCQTFATPAGTATASATQFTGNHGQYVSTSSAKKEAAQSRVGMPVQSKGHTK